LPGGVVVVTRVSVSGNNRAITSGAAGAAGLEVVVRGVRLFEVRARDGADWRTVALATGLAALMLMCVGAWTREARGELSSAQLRECVLLTAATILYALAAIRPAGVVWRFDHPRKAITRRHSVWGMSRRWKSDQIAGIKVARSTGRLGAESIRVVLLDAQGRDAAELGSWDRPHVDPNHIEATVAEIKQAMGWR
jgi:hypothetical protein